MSDSAAAAPGPDDSVDRPTPGARTPRPGNAVPDTGAGGSGAAAATDAREAAAAVLALWEHIEIHAPADVTPTAWRVLSTVEHMAPLTPGDLSRALGMTAASVSRVCARLAAAGLLLRRPHAVDSRSTVLALTPAGDRLVAARREDVMASVRLCLRGVDREHEALRAALGALRHGLRERLRVVPARGPGGAPAERADSGPRARPRPGPRVAPDR